MIQRSMRAWLLLWLFLLLMFVPTAVADPEGEDCETFVAVDHCRGTRSESSASCQTPPLPPGYNGTVCNASEEEEDYERVSVLGVGAEWAERHGTRNGTFDVRNECMQESGAYAATSRGHALRSSSPAGGVWLESDTYEGEIEEDGTHACGGHESTTTEDETFEGRTVAIGSDVGPQPLEVQIRAERSEARLEEHDVDDDRTAVRTYDGLLLQATVNGVGVAPIVATYHDDDGAGCQRRGVLLLFPGVGSRSVDSGCLPQ